jgi:hypothetical protein
MRAIVCDNEVKQTSCPKDSKFQDSPAFGKLNKKRTHLGFFFVLSQRILEISLSGSA